MSAPGTTLGGRLRQARNARHLTQQQVGDLLGTTHATIGQWERNETLPDLRNLVAAAEHYGISLDWIVWGSEVGSGIENRIRKIPATLRPGLVERLHREIDQTEEAAKRLPSSMLGDPVKDSDPRLGPWSAKGANAKMKKGTQ